jgi:hypothetical protein
MNDVLHSHYHEEHLGSGHPPVPSFSHHASHPSDPELRRPRWQVWLENAQGATNLSIHSLRELRVLASQMYRLIDTDFPPAGALERYQAIAEELNARPQQVAQYQPTHDLHERFQDSVFSSRFELYLDGELATYMKYAMHGGQVRLLEIVVRPRFQHLNLDPVLMRHIMFNVHRRRLEVSFNCSVAATFLEENPHFLTLARRYSHPAHEGQNRLRKPLTNL